MPEPVHYHTSKFPPDERLNWIDLIPLIGPASSALARYDEALNNLPNPHLLLAPLRTQEAVFSSRIEGTQTTLNEVLRVEASRNTQFERISEDIREVLNYQRALMHASTLMKEVPLSQRVIKDSHELLFRGVRGSRSGPGEYRRIPVWIGPQGCSQNDARYIPIDANNIDSAMSLWERYIHEGSVDKLVQLAVLHAEFESIHPFMDGNGRIGRLFIPLFLWMSNLIQLPVFYVSEYFESNRDAYYEGLLSVSRDDNWTGWCRVFLTAVMQQASAHLRVISKIRDLHDELKLRVLDLTRSPYGTHAIDWIFRFPVFSGTEFMANTPATRSTVQRLLTSLVRGGVVDIVSEGRGQKATEYAFTKLLSIVEP